MIGIAALLALPASAHAATPPTITGPTGPVAGKPVFTWTNGPAGEVIDSISIGAKPDVDSSGAIASFTGGGTFLYPLDALTTTTTERNLFAGTWYWTAGWKTAEGAAEYARGNTPVQSFVVAPHVRTLQGSFTQYGSIPAFMAKGSFTSNLRAVKVTCTVFNGRKRVSSQVDFTQPYMDRKVVRTNFYCSDLKVPESLDGKRLRLVVVAQGGRTKQTAVKYFRAT